MLLLDPDFFDWKYVDSSMLDIKNLKAVVLTTTTASYVDEKYISQHNIELYNVPKYSTDSVAEYLVMLMMCVAKKIPLQIKNGNRQDFSEKYMQIELKSKTVGVVGLGHIGQRVCEMCEGLGMKVVYYNRSPKDVPYEAVSLDKLFEMSDVVFLTLANNEETRKLITDKHISSMKRTAILISGTGVALHNGELVDRMVANGKLFGFGAEVPNVDINSSDGNMMITSEYAWFTNEAIMRRENIILDNLLNIH